MQVWHEFGATSFATMEEFDAVLMELVEMGFIEQRPAATAEDDDLEDNVGFAHEIVEPLQENVDAPVQERGINDGRKIRVKIPSVKKRFCHSISPGLWDLWISHFKDKKEMEQHVINIYSQLEVGSRVRIMDSVPYRTYPYNHYPPAGFGTVIRFLHRVDSRVTRTEYAAGCGQVIVAYDQQDWNKIEARYLYDESSECMACRFYWCKFSREWVELADKMFRIVVMRIKPLNEDDPLTGPFVTI